jgi:hypothetical protein
VETSHMLRTSITDRQPSGSPILWDGVVGCRWSVTDVSNMWEVSMEGSHKYFICTSAFHMPTCCDVLGISSKTGLPQLRRLVAGFPPAARVLACVRTYGICGRQICTEASCLMVLRYLLPIISPTAPHLSSIFRGWYNRTIVADVPSGLSLTPTQ